MIAPISAIPVEPPTWRHALRTAEPTPAFSTGTARIAAAELGVIVIAIPAASARAVNGSPNSSNFRYTQPLLGNNGSCGRNSFRMNSLTNFDWSFFKDTRLAANPDEMKFAGATLGEWRDRGHDV